MFNKILVPLDGSEIAEQAIERAVDVARQYQAELHFVRAFSMPIIAPSACAAVDLNEIKAAQNKAVREYLNSHAVDELDCYFHALEGDAGESILNLADNENYDLIVLTTHGRSGISRWIFGSIAEKIVRHANCPVMTVRAQEPSEIGTESASAAAGVV